MLKSEKVQARMIKTRNRVMRAHRFDQSHARKHSVMTEADSEAPRLWLDPGTAGASDDRETSLSLGSVTAVRRQSCSLRWLS